MKYRNKTKEELEFILTNNPAVIYTCEYGGNWTGTFISENVENIIGCEAKDFIENPDFWVKGIHPDDSERVFAGLENLIKNDYHSQEYRFLHKDGNYRWVFDETRVVRDKRGEPNECVGFWTDITERKKAEESLRKSRNELRLMYDAITDFMTVISPDYRIMSANRVVENQYGQDIIGKVCYEVYQARDEVCPDCATKRAVETKKPAYSFQPATDVSPPVEISAFPILNEEGEVIAVVENGKDITERMKAEDALRGAKEQLEKQNVQLRKLDKVKDGLILAVSHELKTPVAKHAMQLEILKPILENHGLSEEETKAFTVMEESIRRQENVVRNMLDLFRLEAGGRGYCIEKIHLDEIISKVIDSHQYAIDAYGIEIVSDVQPVMIQSDGEMLWHLLSNLFNNAIKYRNRDVPASITVSVEPRQDEIQIRIADNGIGIDEDDKEILFTRFYQASAASEGSGVGLAICKMIAEGLGGRVWIESEGRGKGTTSIVAIPLL
jgi:PAS domain S-box-containing protein